LACLPSTHGGSVLSQQQKDFKLTFSPLVLKCIGGNNCQIQTTEIAKMVSAAWKAMPADERDEYDELARRDKARYEVERDRYTGPWKVPVTRRPPKDPRAPKRPMSAFLAFSNAKRSKVKLTHPDLSSTAMSKVLARMWKEAPEKEKSVFTKREAILRGDYKVKADLWRQKAENAIQTARQQREDEAHRIADAERDNPSGEGVPQASSLLLTGMSSDCSGIHGKSLSYSNKNYGHDQYNYHRTSSSSKPPPFAEHPVLFPNTSDTLSSAAALTIQMHPPSSSSQYYPQHPHTSSYCPTGDPEFNHHPSLLPTGPTPGSSAAMHPILPSLSASSLFEPPPFDGGSRYRDDRSNQYAPEGSEGYQHHAPQPFNEYYLPPRGNTCGPPPPPPPPHVGYYGK
jgi:high mobility group protein B1